MNKTVLVYYSGTGNTEAMATAMAEVLGIEAINVSDVDVESIVDADKFLLGCSASGAENLEESEFQPFFDELSASLSGKKVALFGSYGWGGGEYMNAWQEDIANAGASLFEQGLVVEGTPNEEDLESCKAFAIRFEND